MNQINSEQQNKKIGEEGEEYIASRLAEIGYKVLYVGGRQLFAITGRKFYTVDLVIFKNGQTFWVQAKHKKPRDFYSDTGMELYQYENLIQHQQESGLPVLVLFTDNSKEIYGEWLDNLPLYFSMKQLNTKNGKMMIYWFAAKLKDYKNLLQGC